MIIFDKDQCLVFPASGNAYVQFPEDQVPALGAKEKVARLAAAGHVLAIATNQGGVELGKKSLESAIAELRFCLGLFPEIKFGALAPNYAGDRAWLVGHDWEQEVFGKGFRKPGPGLLLLAERVGEQQILFVGDRESDRQAAQAANCGFAWASDFWGIGKTNPWD